MNTLIRIIYGFQWFTVSTGWISMCKTSTPKVWDQITSNLKENARLLFIKRAEYFGIPWVESVEQYKRQFTSMELEYHRSKIEDLSINYPDYYLQPFHGYDKGNLEWKAAIECESATHSVSANYWGKGVHYLDAERWMRYNVSKTLYTYLVSNDMDPYQISEILDVGCSIGISSEFLANTFRHANVSGLDLSPYFLSIASYRSKTSQNRIQYIHANAEKIPLENDSIDIVTVNFMFHEVPTYVRKNIFQEIYRVLKPYGVIMILDVDPRRIISHLSFNPFRKWAFEITEPYIFEYYQDDIIDTLYDTGFDRIEIFQNDPVNKIWIGQNCLDKIKVLEYTPIQNIFSKEYPKQFATSFSIHK